MAKLLKLRRGTTTQHSSFTGAEGEVTVDTTKDTLVVHDGSTAGGTPLAKEASPTFTGDVTFDSTTNSGRDLVWDESASALKFTQDAKLQFGGADDLSIYHNGNNSYIVDSGTGGIYIQASDFVVQDTSGGTKFETTASGLKVTNAATAGLNFTAQGSTPEIQFRANSVDEAGEIRVGESTGGGVMQFKTKTTGGTLTQALELGTKQQAVFAGAIHTPATVVSVLDIDCSTSNYFTKTINANSTFTFSNLAASGTVTSFTLDLTVTSGSVTWPTEVKWNGDTAPTITAGKTHLFMFATDDGGLRWRGAALVDYVN